MRNSVLVGIAAVAGLAGSAFAQVSYDARLAFQAGHAAGGAPIDSFEISAPGTYEFTVIGGIFNAMGFESIPSPPGVTQPSSNRGIGNWIGSINASEADLSPRAGGGRTPPFNFGPPIAEGIDGGTMITAIDAARGTATVAWPDGVPEAPQPPSAGNESFVRLYRFTFTVTDVSVIRDITLSATGTMVALANWGIISQTPPDGGKPGETQWAPASAGAPQMAEAGALTLRIIPAPGAAALLGLGGLVAARRRRA